MYQGLGNFTKLTVSNNFGIAAVGTGIYFYYADYGEIFQSNIFDGVYLWYNKRIDIIQTNVSYC